MKYHKKVRVVVDVLDWSIMCQNSEDLKLNLHSIYVSPTFVVGVQVKILWFWITIWREDCCYSDVDARRVILSKADNIQKSLSS